MTTIPQAFHYGRFATPLSRRAALKGLGALVIGVHLPLRARAGEAPAPSPPPVTPNAFIHIAADGMVTVQSKHLEMGQGPWTGLSTLIAEELDADWSQVRCVHAPSDPKLYANLVFGNMQGTGGSSAIANSYEQMRRAGATARAMLVTTAAKRWRVPERDLVVDNGVISHPKSGRKAGFGEFASDAAKLPVPANVALKDPARFKLIGKEALRKLDSSEKSNGTAQYGLDVRVPGMLVVVIARPPRFGGKATRVDETAARAIDGVVDVQRLPTGVAVYAQNTWAALKGRSALQITWDESAAEKRGTTQLLAAYREQLRKPGLVAGKHGDAATALAATTRKLDAEYVFPYLAHAPMEPLDGFVSWDGDVAIARFGSQIQTLDHQALATALGVPAEKVRIETLLAGGSFGRRAQATAHFATELGEVAKASGRRPVKLMWTREDDIRGGYYRPMVVHQMHGALESGAISAWTSRVATQSFMKNSPFEAMMKDGIDPTSTEGASELLYELPNFSCELHTMEVGVPTLWWRSVGHTHTAYAVETFVDELLEMAGKDPVEGRLAMMGKQPRAAGVLRAVAQLAQWQAAAPAAGRARGVAVVESFNTFVAQIAEVSLDAKGEPRVHKVWCAVDCGIAVNPDVIRAQMEGGIGFGLGHALYAEVPLTDGIPDVDNFNHYRSLRIQEMPEVEVVIVASTEPPTGVGEPGVPPIAPAVGNALARLGAGRIRQLPFVRRKA